MPAGKLSPVLFCPAVSSLLAQETVKTTQIVIMAKIIFFTLNTPH
jgi:hypothetical protein